MSSRDMHINKLIERITIIKDNKNSEDFIKKNIKKLRKYCYQLRKKKKRPKKVINYGEKDKEKEKEKEKESDDENNNNNINNNISEKKIRKEIKEGDKIDKVLIKEYTQRKIVYSTKNFQIIQ